MQELVLPQSGKRVAVLAGQGTDDAATQRNLEELLSANAPMAYRVALGVLRNPVEAEDVAQEAMLRAFRRFGLLRDPHKFQSWIVRISFRLAIDRSRSLRRRIDRETRWAQPELRPPPQTAEDRVVSLEFQERLARALDQLPDGQRLVMLLTAIEGHSVEETAAILGVPTGTVKSRVFKARRRLLEMLL